MNRYIGIDIGTIFIGWAILNDSDYLKSGFEYFDKHRQLGWRYEHICEWLDDLFKELIEEGDIVVVGVEYPHLAKKGNIATTIKLAIVWGQVCSSAYRAGAAQVEPIMPSTAKMHFTQSGSASKGKVKAIAQLLKPELENDNESDAIAVAWAARAKYGLKNTV